MTRVKDLQDRNALVTGASRGIGKAIAAELLARGANVVVTARKPEPLEEAAEELRGLGHGGKVLAVAGNAVTRRLAATRSPVPSRSSAPSTS